MDPILKIENELNRELNRQVALIYSAAAIALHRYNGWGRARIVSLMEMTSEVWHECAQTNEKSMIQMLEEETGIEVQNGSGQSWRDLAFLNAKIRMDRMTRPQWIYMRKKQMQWIPPNVTSCILLSLHRRCGFGGDKRLPRIANQIMGIQEELVEAIPVPWIESYLSDCAEMSIAYYVIKQMLYKWREEQEGE